VRERGGKKNKQTNEQKMKYKQKMNRSSLPGNANKRYHYVSVHFKMVREKIVKIHKNEIVWEFWHRLEVDEWCCSSLESTTSPGKVDISVALDASSSISSSFSSVKVSLERLVDRFPPASLNCDSNWRLRNCDNISKEFFNIFNILANHNKKD